MTDSSSSMQIAHLVKRSVLVIDDHPLLRQGLAMLINQQQDLQVCGEAANIRMAMQCIVQLRPDVVILDISLQGPDGLEVLKTIRATNPDLPVLVLSMHDEAIYAERALRARANGYIMKQEATEKVLVAVRRILDGDVYLSEAMSKKLLQQFIDGTPSVLESRIATLSDRELEVFRLIG
jgi:DNA-binding NarL/FixJ family response regulator